MPRPNILFLLAQKVTWRRCGTLWTRDFPRSWKVCWDVGWIGG